ncbi:MAG: helix-turn-helix domain-containing protein [Bacteroidales bacterium]|nr:helix-turn-helix domain-containing protein [Bacteroidales bacterium]
MENPFDLLDQRLQAIELKIDSQVHKMGNQDKLSQPSSTWITTKQLAQHLGISTATITNMRGSKIPFYKIGGRILLKREEIDEFIQKTRHKTGGEYLNEYLTKHH